MDQKLNRTQIVLDDFKKTVDELAKEVAAQKQHDVDIQLENLRQQVKELRQPASAPEPGAL
jgi:hypothetical protein